MPSPAPTRNTAANARTNGFVSAMNVARGYQRAPGTTILKSDPNYNKARNSMTSGQKAANPLPKSGSAGGLGAIEPAVISTIQGKNVLDQHIQNQNTDVSNIQANNPLNPNKPVSGQPAPAPKIDNTKSNAMKSAGGVTADEAKATGVDLSKGYTYDQQTGYFMPSSPNSSVAPTSTPEAVRAKYQKEIDDTNDVFKSMTGGMDASTNALISSLNAIYQDRIKAQMGVNANEEASFNTMNLRGGTSRYAGGVAQSIMTAQENAGLDRIKTISNELADKISTANSNLQDKKYAAFIENRNEIDKLRAAQTAEIKDLHDQAVEQQKQQYLEKQDAIKNDLELKKYDLSVSNSKVENDLKRAQIAEIYAKMSPADLSSANSWVKNIKNGTAKFSDVPDNLKNAVSVGVANGGGEKTNDILGTTKTSLDELNAMVNEGPGLLGQAYDVLKNALPGGGLLPNAGTGFTSAVGLKGASSFFGLKEKPLAGTQAAAFDAKLNQVKNDIILPNLTLLHGLGRVTDREFQALSSAITSLSTNLPEDQFKLELKNITDRISQKISDNQDNVVGDNIREAIQNKYTPDQIVTTYMQDPAMASKIQAARAQGYSDQDIINYYLNK